MTIRPRLLFAGFCLMLGCVPSAPTRQDPLTGSSLAPAYPEVTAGLVLSENTRNAVAYGKQGARYADFDPEVELGKDLEVYRRNFKSVQRLESVDAAAKTDVDLIILVDNFADVGSSVKLESGAVVLNRGLAKVAELRGRAEEGIGFGDPGQKIIEVGARARAELEQKLRGAPELREEARKIAAAREKQIATPALQRPNKMVVLPLRPVGGVTKETAQLLTSLLLAKISNVQGLTAIGQADIEAMLGVEKQKDLLGCSDTSCMAEVGGALGAELVLHGEVGVLGARYNLNVSVVRATSSTVLARVSRVTDASAEAVAAELDGVVREVVVTLNK